MNEENIKLILSNQKEIINRLVVLEKALNSILPAPIKFRKPVVDEKPMGMKEVCELLNIGSSTLSIWSLNGKIPFHYEKGGRKYYKSELDDWILHRPKK